MQTNGGRSTFSVLLSQDIAVIPMLALLPLLALPAIPQIAADGSIDLADDLHHDGASTSLSLVEGLPGWGVTLVTMGAIAFVILAGIYLSAPCSASSTKRRLREMYTALALMIVVGIGFLMMLVGLSPALGAFLAGVGPRQLGIPPRA